jgi:hypothetical protein
MERIRFKISILLTTLLSAKSSCVLEKTELSTKAHECVLIFNINLRLEFVSIGRFNFD